MVLIARRPLQDVYSTLLPLCYWQRVANFYLYAVPSAITVWFLLLTGWTPSFSLLAPYCSPLISSVLTTCHCLLPAGSSRPYFRFFLYSTRRSTNRPALLAVSSGGLLRATHFLKLAPLSLNVGCSPLSTTLASLCSQLVTGL